MNLARGLIILMMLWVASAAPGQTRPTSQPTREEQTRKLFDFLTGEYGALFKKNKDWVNRSVAIISLSRMPTPAATGKILEQLQSERHPVGRLVAWEAMLARAPRLTDAEYKAFWVETVKMLKTDHFHGDLRVALLEVLSATPVTIDSRNFWKEVFAQTSALDSADIPTLIALGRAMRAWGDPVLYEAVINALADAGFAVRAELILKAAGADVPWTLSKDSRAAYTKWWQANKTALTAAKPPADGWKKLGPHWIAGPEDISRVDPSDKRWYRELELGPLGLKNFDFAVSLDCSRSMTSEIERLKRDLRVMYTALSTVASEPRIGITQFAPGNTVQTIPLTGNIKQLTDAVAGVGIIGPAGEEEWAGSIQRTIADSKWIGAGEKNRRVIILISDEPITAAQYDLLMPIAKRAAKDGFRIYTVPVQRLNVPTDPLLAMRRADRLTTSPRRPGGKGGGRMRMLGEYEDVAEATGASMVVAHVPQTTFGLGTPPSSPAQMGMIAPVYPDGGPTTQVLTRVLSDAINPQYADRVEPLVRVLVAWSEKAAPRRVEQRSGFGQGLPGEFPR